MIKVQLFDKQSDLVIDPKSVQKVVSAALALEQSQADELSVYFVDTKEICHLHEEFFDDPSVTDCISFPMDSDKSLGYQFLGEVFVCPKTAIDYVAERGGDPYSEATLYLVHGILHLLGYDDIAEEDERVMRDKEKKIMLYLADKKILLRK